MSPLVTGASGFVGPNLVRKLLAEGNMVRCYVRRIKDVVVRVAGYSASFVNLSKGLQEEVIARAEWGNE